MLFIVHQSITVLLTGKVDIITKQEKIKYLYVNAYNENRGLLDNLFRVLPSIDKIVQKVVFSSSRCYYL